MINETNTGYAQLESLGKHNLQERVRETLTAIGFQCGTCWVDDNRQVTVRVFNLPKTDGTIQRRFDKQSHLRCDRWGNDDPVFGDYIVVTVL